MNLVSIFLALCSVYGLLIQQDDYSNGEVSDWEKSCYSNDYSLLMIKDNHLFILYKYDDSFGSFSVTKYEGKYRIDGDIHFFDVKTNVHSSFNSLQYPPDPLFDFKAKIEKRILHILTPYESKLKKTKCSKKLINKLENEFY